MGTDTDKDDVPAFVREWLKGKRAEDFNAIEVGGRTLYPDTLKRKLPKSSEVKEEKIWLRTPTVADRAQAMLFTIEWATTKLKQKTPLNRDQVRQYFGTVGDDIETVGLMAACIRNEDGSQFMLPQLMIDVYPMPPIFELYNRLDMLMRIEDPRIGEMDDATFWATVEAIDRVRNLSPLAATDGFVQDAFIIAMAVRLRSYRMPKSSSPSTPISSPAETMTSDGTSSADASDEALSPPSSPA